MNTSVVEEIISYANKAGCAAKLVESVNGGGVFIHVTGKQRAVNTDNQTKTLVIRVAEYPLPKNYRILTDFVDFEVGDHAQADGSWFECIAWLARKLGSTIPDKIRDLQNLQLKSMEKKLSELADNQFEHVFNKALDKCRKQNALLYNTYHELHEVTEIHLGPEKIQQAADKNLKAAMREILLRYG